jgi:hypothetical protein
MHIFPRQLAEFLDRRRRQRDGAPKSPRSDAAAQALLAGLMQGMGVRENDPNLHKAGDWLAEAASAGFPRDAEGRPMGVRFIGWRTEPRPGEAAPEPEASQTGGVARRWLGLRALLRRAHGQRRA